MDAKTNDSTPQRPEGHRILNDQSVEMDVQHFIHQIKSEKNWKEGEKNSITLFKSDKMRIVLIGLHQNAELKKHSANAIISVQVLEGNIEFAPDNSTHLLSSGQIIALQPNLSHRVVAKTESFFLLTLAS